MIHECGVANGVTSPVLSGTWSVVGFAPDARHITQHAKAVTVSDGQNQASSGEKSVSGNSNQSGRDEKHVLNCKNLAMRKHVKRKRYF